MQTYPPGSRIGQYEIASRPMMGGMGVVYFALDHGNDGRPVAIKTFRPELLPDRAARNRFLREGTAWIELGSHPHIVRCYKVEYFDPTAFLVLELIAKEQYMHDASLRSWLIPGHPLPVEQALLFAFQIARGMQHATEKIPGFVHRDLKPENILVGADKLPGTKINCLKVTDFGLAKALGESELTSDLSGAEELKLNNIQFTHGVGTPLYMAPEQWRGEPVGIFTDVYAFGCILYEMMSGKHTVEGKTITALQASHFRGKLRHIPNNWPKNVVVLLKKCLMTDSDQRYKSWDELMDVIENSYSKQFNVSIPVTTGAIETNRETRIQEGWSYNAIGYAYLDIGDANASVVYFKRALTIANSWAEQRLSCATLGNLGLAQVRLSDIQNAIRNFQEALRTAGLLGARDYEGTVLGSLGIAYYQLGDFQKSIECHEQHLQIAREISDWRGQIAALGNIGLAYANSDNPNRAVEQYEEQLAVSRKNDYLRGQNVALGNLGSAYIKLGQFPLAIKSFKEALKLDRKIGDLRGEAIDLGNLGLAYSEAGKFQEAIKYYEQAQLVYYRIRDQQGNANNLLNLGGVHLKFGNISLALEYLNQALTIHREIGDRYGEAYDLGNLGNAYAIEGDLLQAIEYYKQQLIITREINDLNGIAMASFNVALLYMRQNSITDSLPYAQEAAQVWLQIDSPNAERARALVATLEDNKTDFIQLGFERFQQAESLEELRDIVSRFPFMMNETFIQVVRKILNKRVHPDDKSSFERRINWLSQIVGK